MTADELELFDMIDAARVRNGCAPLEQDPNLTGGARAEAEDRAESGAVNSYTDSKTAAGGDNWSAQQAFDQMMAQKKSVVLNCNLKTLGVGMDDARYKACMLGPVLCTTRTRVAWVADFT
ncbi:CAP domain-containing protein [Kribbella turkmenica]|uniref:CAP domain-containing protein n=2 Tax=Kribbella turkmenica TaxID=2530375 RepID=A0A4R4WAT5_9ACTN|nr:CAP domain-containing protein [Kribbella turkmenica]